MDDLRIGKWDIQPSKTVYHSYKCIEINGNIICDIQVKVGIQHGNCLCRSAQCICSVGLGVGIIFYIEKSISVNGHQLDSLRVIIDACNDDGITVLCVQLLILASVIQTEQCICGISCHLRCLIIGYDILLCKICLLNIDLIQLG